MISRQTATGEFDYNQTFYDTTLDELIFLTHKDLSSKLKWKYFPLKRGSFGYDNMAMSIGTMLRTLSNDDIEQAAELVHQGWVKNYKWWRDIGPHKLLPDIYIGPSKPLGDKRRNQLANCKYSDLPESEKETNLIIARYLLNYSSYH